MGEGTEIKKCIICNGELYQVIDLGLLPNPNNLVLSQDLQKVNKYPLIYFCCESCSLLQQTEFVAKNKLFTNYPYLTGTSPALVEHFNQMSKDLAKLVKKKRLAYVIGSNDGTERTLMRNAGFRKVVGIDPANLVKGNPNTVNAFFTYKLSQDLAETYGRADLITCNNTFAHIPDPLDMMLGMSNLINEDGLISIEVSWLKNTVERLEVETLYAEHYFVWSIRAMSILVQKCGLYVADIIYLSNQHGGSLRFLLRKQAENMAQISAMATKLAVAEARRCTKENMLKIQKRTEVRRQKFLNLIRALKCDGNKLAIYSVPAKMITWLNFCNITSKQIDYAYDTSSTKVGKIIPMANILIKSEKDIIKDMPDYMLVGAWNYWPTIQKKLKHYLDKSGALINPLTLEIIER